MKKHSTENIDLLGESIISEKIRNISSDLLEVGLDVLLEDGLLKDIPIIGTIVGLTKAGIGIREKIYKKKILKFLFEIKDIPLEQRKKFVNKINTNPNYTTKVGETILNIIDKLDDLKKAELIGKLFIHSINDDIDYDTFLRLSRTIERCFLSDLSKLRDFYSGKQNKVTDFDKDILYNLGLLRNMGVEDYISLQGRNQEIPRKQIAYKISKYGRLIVELLLIK